MAKKTTLEINVPTKFTKDNAKEKRLYVTKKYYWCVGDKYNFILKEVNNKKNKAGNKYPDTCIAFAGSIKSMLTITASHFPSEVISDDIKELKTILTNIENWIEKAIPVDCKPCDLFAEVDKDDNE